MAIQQLKSQQRKKKKKSLFYRRKNALSPLLETYYCNWSEKDLSCYIIIQYICLKAGGGGNTGLEYIISRPGQEAYICTAWRPHCLIQCKGRVTVGEQRPPLAEYRKSRASGGGITTDTPGFSYAVWGALL